MRDERIHALTSFWILDFVLLALLVAPANDGTSLLVMLMLWSVPTLILAVVTWRVRHPHHPG
jgi:hypothetical protein